MKQIIKKKVILVACIFFMVLLLLLLINMFNSKELIKQVIPKIFRQNESEEIKEITVDGISCKVLDNTGEKIKAFVTITRENGIEKIEYLASNEKTIVLNCNNKQKVTIDIEMFINEEQQFKVISNGEEKIETVSLNENYIDDYINIVKLDNESPYDQVDIEFNSVQPSINYYKINNCAWNTYSSTLSFDLSSVEIGKLLNSQYEITIYTMSVDSAGNVLQTNKTIELTKKCPNFNLFHNMDISGKTNLGEYALRVTSWSGSDSEWRWFQVRAMGGGHYHGSGSFNVVITMNWNEPEITFDNITTTFALYAEGCPSRGTVRVNYTDGTSTSSGTGTYNRAGIVYWNATVKPDRNKQISNIQYICSGSDSSGNGSWSRVQEIYFNGLQKVNN